MDLFSGTGSVTYEFASRGAASILAVVPERLKAGQLEVALKEHTSDKTNWRALLKGENSDVDLVEQRKRFLELIPEEFSEYVTSDSNVYTFEYPLSSPSRLSI